MSKYMVVTRAESKYFRSLNEHKVTNLFMCHLEGGRAGIRVTNFFF